MGLLSRWFRSAPTLDPQIEARLQRLTEMAPPPTRNRHRKSRYVKVRRVPRVDTESVAAATVDALRGLPVASLTNDNGAEFQRDESLQSRLGTIIYFCHPSSPWERGSIENTNGLFRQYCPTSCDFDTMAPWGPAALEDTLNFRPRKVLGYRTPHEAFYGVNLNLMNNPQCTSD